jgi:hypothetical protein
MEPTIKITAMPPSSTAIVSRSPTTLGAPIPVIRMVIGVIPTIDPAIVPIIRVTVPVIRVTIACIRLTRATTQAQKNDCEYPVRNPDYHEHLIVENRHGTLVFEGAAVERG